MFMKATYLYYTQLTDCPAMFLAQINDTVSEQMPTSAHGMQ